MLVSQQKPETYSASNEPSLEDLIAVGSLFIGLETVLGPIYLAYKKAGKGQNSFYFYLGHMF
jgi:NTE family protein